MKTNLKIEIEAADVATFWEMLETAVNNLGSAIDGNSLHLNEVGRDTDAEDTVLEYARFLTLYRKLSR